MESTTISFNLTVLGVILAYYIIINLVLYCAMALDKKRAIKNRRRIPEKTMFLLAILGGGAGGLFGMVLNRHKTHHLDFVMAFTITSILHLLVALLLISKFVVIG